MKQKQNQTEISKYFSKSSLITNNRAFPNYSQYINREERQIEIETKIQQIEEEDLIVNLAKDDSNTLMEIEESKEKIEETKEEIKGEIADVPQETPVQIKHDLRKVNSGRKCKSAEETLKEYQNDICYRNWLQDEIRISLTGESQIFLYCIWCRESHKNNQMAQGVLFSTNRKISRSFSSTRLQEHGKINSQHKRAKQIIFQKRFELIIPQTYMDTSEYHLFTNLFEFILLSVKKKSVSEFN